MKTHKILLALAIILLIFYFALDRQLYYYGRNNLNIYHILPLGIKPVFRYEFDGGFAFEDRYGFRFIRKGEFRHENSNLNIHIAEILKYGYNDNKLVVFIQDINSQELYIECKKKYNNQTKAEIQCDAFHVINLPLYNELKWIEIKNNVKYIHSIGLIRNLSAFFTFVILIFFLREIITNPKSN